MGNAMAEAGYAPRRNKVPYTRADEQRTIDAEGRKISILKRTLDVSMGVYHDLLSFARSAYTPHPPSATQRPHPPHQSRAR